MPAVYSTAQKVFLVTQVLSGHSARKARDLFAVEFPDSPIPSLHTVQKCLHKFQKQGCLNNDHPHATQKKRGNYQLTEEVQTRICASVEVNPNITSREIAQELGVSKTSVLKTLKEAGYYQHRHRGCILPEKGKRKAQSLRMWSRENPYEMVTTQYAETEDE